MYSVKKHPRLDLQVIYQVFELREVISDYTFIHSNLTVKDFS